MLQRKSEGAKSKLYVLDSSTVTNPSKLTSTQKRAEFLRSIWDDQLIEVREQFYAVFLDAENNVIDCDLLSSGTENCCHVEVKQIASLALRNEAVSVIVAHNHPSGRI